MPTPTTPRRLALVFALVAALVACSSGGSGAEPRPPSSTVAPAEAGQRGEFHAAPGGTPEGRGTADDPWDLVTALRRQSAAPGSTIWLAEGEYQGAFESRLEGTADEPIVVRALPGARAHLVGNRRQAPLTVLGPHTWFWGLEVSHGNPDRTATDQGAAPRSIDRATGINVFGPGTKLVNVVVHDANDGIGFWVEAPDSEIYGSLVFNNGHQGPDRGWGHGIYAQNRDGTKAIADNIVFNQFGSGIHVYGSSDTWLDGFLLEGNISFGNGAPSTHSYDRNLVLGGGRVAQAPVLRDNYTFTPIAARDGEVNLGYDAGCDGAVLRGNYFVERNALKVVGCAFAEAVDNTFIGAVDGLDRNVHAGNRFLTEPPATADVFVRPNRFEPGRANIVVFNWPGAASVAVDLGAAGLTRGVAYEIRDVQDFYGEPVWEGTWDGAPVSLPMDRTAIARPLGDAPVEVQHTGPEFGAFVIVPAG